MATHGIPSTVTLGMAVNPLGSDEATTSLPPTTRMSMPMMM
jgi:hypothetical protein